MVTHYTHTYRFGAFLTRSRIMACSFSRLHLSGRWRCYCVQRQASASRSCITIIKLFNPKSMTTQAINITHASSWENACFHTFTLVICGNLQVKKPTAWKNRWRFNSVVKMIGLRHFWSVGYLGYRWFTASAIRLLGTAWLLRSLLFIFK